MKIKFTVVVLFILVISNLFAFDGKRKGFILGFGAGFSNISFKQKIEGYGGSITSDKENKIGFGSDFKIGYAPNNKVEIYYFSKVAWFSILNALNDNVTISDGVAGAGLSYYLSPKLNENEWTSSTFISCGFGWSGWSTPFEEGSESWTGLGFFVGSGYEFSKHYRIEANLFINNPSTKESGYTYTTNSTVLMIIFSALAF